MGPNFDGYRGRVPLLVRFINVYISLQRVQIFKGPAKPSGPSAHIKQTFGDSLLDKQGKPVDSNAASSSAAVGSLVVNKACFNAQIAGPRFKSRCSFFWKKKLPSVRQIQASIAESNFSYHGIGVPQVLFIHVCRLTKKSFVQDMLSK